jgi:hypothetical protein
MPGLVDEAMRVSVPHRGGNHDADGAPQRVLDIRRLGVAVKRRYPLLDRPRHVLPSFTQVHAISTHLHRARSTVSS